MDSVKTPGIGDAIIGDCLLAPFQFPRSKHKAFIGRNQRVVCIKICVDRTDFRCSIVTQLLAIVA